MLLTIPLALQVSRGLEPNYDNPYGLMAVMGVNVKLHLVAGLALLAGYAVVLIAGAVAPDIGPVPGLNRTTRGRPRVVTCRRGPEV